MLRGSGAATELRVMLGGIGGDGSSAAFVLRGIQTARPAFVVGQQALLMGFGVWSGRLWIQFEMDYSGLHVERGGRQSLFMAFGHQAGAYEHAAKCVPVGASRCGAFYLHATLQFMLCGRMKARKGWEKEAEAWVLGYHEGTVGLRLCAAVAASSGHFTSVGWAFVRSGMGSPAET
ncbi:hypothetical protein EPH_0006480 [Eimeria praecox]|uniref:Uncharacterized protein n=1 Tax=Eimeria praecox TaxID=51316 RepID=U6GB84_9EIME|nr:hypothetical protein EPH_0006480 [Eimeria praecox]